MTRKKSGSFARRAPLLAALFLVGTVASHNQMPAVSLSEKELEIDHALRGFFQNLGVAYDVDVRIVSEYPTLVSVQFAEGRKDAFQMTFEARFLESLETREIRAAVAHEVGHIWLFTHFPYLHTETLANHEALKLVSRPDLEKLYAKVWNWKGQRGDLAAVLGGAEGDGK